MPATTTLYPTTVAGSTGATWTTTTNATGSTTGTTSAAWAVFTNATNGGSGGTGTLTLSGYAAQPAVTSGNTIDSVVLSLRGNVGATARWTAASCTAQLFSGTTAIGSPVAVGTLSTTTSNVWTITFSGANAPTYVQLSDLRVQVTAVHTSTTSSTFNVDTAGLVVNHSTPVVPTITDSVSAIPDMVARYRADQVTGVADGAAVASWPDASGYAYTASQATAGNRPTYVAASLLGGQPAVRFTRANITFLASGAPSSAQTQTVVAIFRRNAGTGVINTIRAGNGNTALQVRLETSGVLGMVNQEVANLATSSTTLATGANYNTATALNFTTGAYSYTVNGVAAGSGTTSTGTFVAGRTTVIGTHPVNLGNEALDADVAELIVWNRVLTSTELATVQTYYTARYTSVPAPGQVVGLAANGRTGGVDLTWTATSTATSYKVLRNGVQIGTTTGTLYSDYGGTVGTSASYTVVATNSGGDGTASASASAAPLATAAPLAAWQAALTTRATTPAVWLALGDSITEGQGATTRANRWIDKTRDSLRTSLAIAGGVGYLPGWYATYGPDSPWEPYSSRSGSVTNIDWGADLGERAVQLATGGSQTYTVTGTHADLWWMSNGGTFTWAVDGGTATAVNTAGTYSGDNRTRISLGTSGSHTVTITATTGPVYFAGVTVFDGDRDTGLHLYDASHTAWTSSQFVDDPPGQLQEIPKIAATAGVDLVTVALGANDWSTSATAATLKTNVQTLIAAMRVRIPTASFVVAVMYERGDLPAGGWDPYRSALLAIATDDPTIGVLDFYDDMGRATTSGLWVSDAIHPSDAGHASMANLAAAYLAPTTAAVITGTGASTASATGSATGSRVATGAGASTASATGAGSGAGVAAGAGQATATSVATGTGVRPVPGAGSAIGAAAGAATGVPVRTGAAAATATAVTTSAGTPLAAGSGASTATATAIGASNVVASGAGAASASSTATASSIVVVGGSGTSTATSTGTGIGSAITPGVTNGTGASSATSTATAAGRVVATGSGQASASSTGTLTGRVVIIGAGAATATSTSAGAGASVTSAISGTGASTATATASGTGTGIATGTGESTASSTGSLTGRTVIVGAGAATATATATATGVAVGSLRDITLTVRPLTTRALTGGLATRSLTVGNLTARMLTATAATRATSGDLHARTLTANLEE